MVSTSELLKFDDYVKSIGDEKQAIACCECDVTLGSPSRWGGAWGRLWRPESPDNDGKIGESATPARVWRRNPARWSPSR